MSKKKSKINTKVRGTRISIVYWIILIVVMSAAVWYFIPKAPVVFHVPEAPDGYVLDEAEILTDDFERLLNLEIAQFERATSVEISVVTIKSLEGKRITEYANKLFNKWGIGQGEVDNGVLLLVAPNEKEVRIEVGYGLEGVITDLKSARIIDNVLLPRFRAGRFEDGIKEGLDNIMAVSQDESFEVAANPYDADAEWPAWVWILIIIGVIVYIVMISIFPFLFGTLIGVPMTIGFAMGGDLIVGIIVGLLISIILGWIFQRSLKNAKENSGGGSGSESNDNWPSSGGSSSGGFGGGSSGGGGASGSW